MGIERTDFKLMSSINDNYPPGAANDPSAPYNQPEDNSSCPNCGSTDFFIGYTRYYDHHTKKYRKGDRKICRICLTKYEP